MAVSFIQQPTLTINPAYSDIVYSIQNGQTSQFYHKYLLQVYVGGALVATLKTSANAAGNGIFNISNILQDYCKTDIDGFVSPTSTGSSTFNGVSAATTQHAIHQTDGYANNKDNIKQFYVKASEEYATTADGTVAVQPYNAISTNKLVWNGVDQHENGFETFNAFDYVLSADTKKLLTGFADTINRKVRKTDYHTVAFFNGKFGSAAAQQSTPDKFSIKFYNDAGAQQGATVDYDIDVAASNGALLGSLLPYPALATTTPALVYFGCGGKNITNNGTTIPAAATYYTVQAYNGATEVSKAYRFDFIEDDCKGFETVRLAYLNRLGAWDYYNFTKKSTRTTAIQKGSLKTNYGTWGNSKYTYGVYETGAGVFNVKSNETIEANTDFISEAEATALEELFTSPQVFMQNDSGNFEPVVISESSYTKQTKANDKVIQYVIGLHKAHNKRIQRI